MSKRQVAILVLPRIFEYSIEERLELLKVASGLLPADLVIVNADLVSVTTGEILENVGVVIKGKRIVRVAKPRELKKYIGKNTLVLDADSSYLIPGFIDPHIHIESSLLTPRNFAKLALRHGTTTVVADPHEIANVLGVEGIKLFIEETRDLPLKVLVDAPSCVPATNPAYGLESSNKTIGSDEIRKLAELEGVIGLGEVMDFLGVIRGEYSVLEKIEIARCYNLRINGHAPMLRGERLDAYISAGIYSDHETMDVSEALEKMRKGMHVFIREGSAWRDLDRLVKILIDEKTSIRYCSFASDDLSVLDLYEKGHMDRIVNYAVEHGVDPIKAIQLATLNPATWLHLEEHIGVIAPGRLADIMFTKNINYISPHTVIANGEIIYFKGEFKRDFAKYRYPEKALKTVNISRSLGEYDIVPRIEGGQTEVYVNVIEVVPGSVLTRRRVERLSVCKGRIQPDIDRDIVYVSVIERHRGIGSIGKGFIKGLGFRAGALAQTIAHDTHNLVVAGYRASDMVLAVNRIIELQGGIVVVDRGEVLAEVPLRYAGLMSTEEPEIVYQQYKDLVETIKKKYGALFEQFFMTLSLISLPVIPEIRLTDRGLVDVANAKIIRLVVDSSQ